MNVTISEYLKSRRYNRKTFSAVTIQLQELEHDASVEFNMDARSQTPVAIIRGPHMHAAEESVMDILNCYFNVHEPYQEHDQIRISFSDQW